MFKILRDKKGQGLVEYALILALVAVVVMGILGILGQHVSTKLQLVSDKLAK